MLYVNISMSLTLTCGCFSAISIKITDCMAAADTAVSSAIAWNMLLNSSSVIPLLTWYGFQKAAVHKHNL